MISRALLRHCKSKETNRFLSPRGQGRLLSYADTVANLRINSETRVIFQGFTGKQATFDAQQSLEYGTKIVGGVRPGKDGEHLGLPVLPSMKAAVKHLKPDATAVYVAASGAAAAIEEAIEAEVPLIVAVAEFIPFHDMLRVQEILRTQSKSRLVGPNCPGMMNPHARCRIGFPPIPFFQPGSVGIVSKSGTLSYETVASTTRAGLGQSLVVGIGGDPLPGTDFVDVLKILEHDENTKGIIIIGEIGGVAEERAADWILEYRRRTTNPKPIVALVAGENSPTGKVMGHAGAIVRAGQKRAEGKLQILKKAGAILTDHPEKFGNVMRMALSRSQWIPGSSYQTANSFHSQKRSMHSFRRLRTSSQRGQRTQQQVRHFRVSAEAVNLAEEIRDASDSKAQVKLQIIVDTSTYTPSIRITKVSSGIAPKKVEFSYPYSIEEVEFKDLCRRAINDAVARLTFPEESNDKELYKPSWSDESLVVKAWDCARTFKQNDALAVTMMAAYSSKEGKWQTLKAKVLIDDSAYKSSKRQEDLFEQRDTFTELPAVLEAEKHGIVYVQLPGNGNIGTLVNGAGLAMNTVDALKNLGGRPTNFLDTGGKATSETVSQSFRTILTDSRVTAIFVNIFGGLTLCDMIARGILMAYKDVAIQVPVVVRLRGTNEKEGQKIIAESGLPIEAFDEFKAAAKRVMELSDQPKV